MDTVELITCLQNDPLIRNHLCGVFPREVLPKLDVPGIYVVNTDTSKGGGRHWFLVYIDENRVCTVYDSLGASEHSRKLLGELPSVTPVYFSVKRFQSSTTAVCGCYCLYFARELTRGHCAVKLEKNFSVFNTLANDLYVKECTRKHFGVNVPLYDDSFILN